MAQSERKKIAITDSSNSTRTVTNEINSAETFQENFPAEDNGASGDSIGAVTSRTHMEKDLSSIQTDGEISEINKSINEDIGLDLFQDNNTHKPLYENQSVKDEEWEIISISYEKQNEEIDQASIENSEAIQETDHQIQIVTDRSAIETDNSSKKARNRMGDTISIDFNNKEKVTASIGMEESLKIQHSTDAESKTTKRKRTKSSEFVYNLLSEFIDPLYRSNVDENHNNKKSKLTTENANSIYKESKTGEIKWSSPPSEYLNESSSKSTTLQMVSNITQEFSNESLDTATTEHTANDEPEADDDIEWFTPPSEYINESSSESTILHMISNTTQEFSSETLNTATTEHTANDEPEADDDIEWFTPPLEYNNESSKEPTTLYMISNTTQEFSTETLDTAITERTANDDAHFQAEFSQTSTPDNVGQIQESVRHLSISPNENSPIDVHTTKKDPNNDLNSTRKCCQISELPPFPIKTGRNSQAKFTKRKQTTQPSPREFKRKTKITSLHDLEAYVAVTLKTRHPHLSLANNTCLKVATLLLDIVHRIGDESKNLVTMTDKKSLDSRVLQYAIKLCLERMKDEADVATGKRDQWLF